MKDKFLSDIDAFLKADHGTAFDRTYFSRRKQVERRLVCRESVEVGHITRSGRDRRVIPERRKSWKRNLRDKMNVALWET